MKTKEELKALKEEVETVSRKLRELTEEELTQVSGGKDYSPQQWKDLLLYILRTSREPNT